MSGNRWGQPGVPHKGWHSVDVVDLRAEGEPADETDYATCQSKRHLSTILDGEN